MPSAVGCLNGACPLVHMDLSLLVQHWTVEPLGGTLVDPFADLADPFADLASLFLVLVVTGFFTVEDVLPCGVSLGFVSPCVGFENWIVWCSRSISLPAPLLLFRFGQTVVLFTSATFVRGGAAAVAAFFSWLGCGMGSVCLGLPGLGLVFLFRCGLFGSFAIVIFGFN